jgi:hypothetical protein
VEGATLMARVASSPWILRYPQLGFRVQDTGRRLGCCGGWAVGRVVWGEMRWRGGGAAGRGASAG